MESDWLRNFGLVEWMVITIVILVTTLFLSMAIYWTLHSMAQKKIKIDASRILIAGGESAQAAIHHVGRTGMRIGDEIVYKILLTVLPAGRPAYQAEIVTLISDFQFQIQSGAVVPVKIDPNNPQIVALDIDRQLNKPG